MNKTHGHVLMSTFNIEGFEEPNLNCVWFSRDIDKLEKERISLQTEYDNKNREGRNGGRLNCRYFINDCMDYDETERQYDELVNKSKEE